MKRVGNGLGNGQNRAFSEARKNGVLYEVCRKSGRNEINGLDGVFLQFIQFPK